MEWWNSFVSWFYSDAGSHVITTAIVPGVAIIVAGIVAALIGRSSTKRVITLHDRAERSAAVTAIISTARQAANWNTLSAPEQQQADHVALECDVRLRLLPLSGAGLAADWAAHEITAMRKQAISFSFQAAQSLKEFKNRLIEWQDHPSRAKKLFKSDLDSWAYEDSLNDQDLVAQQKAWEAQQSAPAPETTPSPDIVEETPAPNPAPLLRVGVSEPLLPTAAPEPSDRVDAPPPPVVSETD